MPRPVSRRDIAVGSILGGCTFIAVEIVLRGWPYWRAFAVGVITLGVVSVIGAWASQVFDRIRDRVAARREAVREAEWRSHYGIGHVLAVETTPDDAVFWTTRETEDPLTFWREIRSWR